MPVTYPRVAGRAVGVGREREGAGATRETNERKLDPFAHPSRAPPPPPLPRSPPPSPLSPSPCCAPPSLVPPASPPPPAAWLGARLPPPSRLCPRCELCFWPTQPPRRPRWPPPLVAPDRSAAGSGQRGARRGRGRRGAARPLASIVPPSPQENARPPPSPPATTPQIGPHWAPPGRALPPRDGDWGGTCGAVGARRGALPRQKNARPPALPPLPPSSRARPHWRPPPFERAQCGRVCARGPRA